MVGRDAETNEPVRRRQAIEEVHFDRHGILAEKMVGGVVAGGAGSDDGDAERGHAAVDPSFTL